MLHSITWINKSSRRKCNKGYNVSYYHNFSIFIFTYCHLLFPINYKTYSKNTKGYDTVKDEEFKLVEGINSNDEIGQLVNTYNSMVNKISELINTVYRISIREKEAQLNALQSQINPHFLYNTLNSISCIAQVKGVEEISNISKALSDMFRYSIKAGNEMVTLLDEINSIKNYMLIQGIRYDNRIEIKYDIRRKINEL